MITHLRYKNLQRAWEGINEFLATQEQAIMEHGGGVYGTEFISYNNYVIIDKAIVNPNFDFGKVLGYKDKKWSSLVNNYVDFNYLELIKNEIQTREAKNAKSYNHSYHFNNSHGSGKDCLVSLILSRRLNKEYPVALFHVRTSEVTKRLLFDFLLVQRILEYIYGEEIAHKCEVHFMAPTMYITAESFSMYNNHRPLRKIMKPYKKDPGKFQARIFKVFKEFSTVDPKTVKYKVNLRAVMQIQKNEDGESKSKCPSLFAKDLHIVSPHDIYPDDAISPLERKRSKRK